MRKLTALLAFLLLVSGQAQIDEGYTAKIREYTIEPFFLTDLVDHLPASATVPTPEAVLGYVVGTPNRLTHSGDVHRYMRELARTSPRVTMESMGRSEEGREMILVLISDEANLARLDRLREITRLLGDPRLLTPSLRPPGTEGLAEAAEPLIKEGLSFYWLTGAMHATESGSPEMLMELAYRLAVDEGEFISRIRRNSVVMITPVLDVDGRDRHVDTYMYRKANPDKPPIPLIYWGKYVAHDINRDGMAISTAMSRAVMDRWFHYRPQVLHDLHESVPFLYVSTGTGPYNAWLDPITVDEWHILAYHEVNEMTRRGVPGVWTHGFYDGWAPNYMFYAANGHNAIGRFYETYGGVGADTLTRNVGGQSERVWYRPNPPYNRVRWSLRNNTNLMQSGVLLGLEHVAREKEKFLRNYYLKSLRSVLKPWNEGPAAYVITPNDARWENHIALIKLIDRQGVEVHELTSAFTVGGREYPGGTVVVRMDQPYSRMADMLLDRQFFNPSDPRPYDDTGWTLGPLFDVEVVRITDAAILQAPMKQYEIIHPRRTLATLSSRVALIHNWQNTQDEGWFRIAFETAGVPFTYTSVHELRDTTNLRDKYDVIILPQMRGTAQSIVNGIPKVGDPIPWKPLPGFPHLGGPDTTDDIRGGIELEGILNLKRFAENGGTLIFIGNSCSIPIDYGLVTGVSIVQPQNLFAPGGVFLTERVARDHPVLEGYSETLAVYFNQRSLPILSVGGGGPSGETPTRGTGRGGVNDPDIAQGRPPHSPPRRDAEDEEQTPRLPQPPRPQVLLRYAPVDRLLVSGGLANGEELAGRAALIEFPLGEGRILLFSFNPMWRQQTIGSWNLIFNAAGVR